MRRRTARRRRAVVVGGGIGGLAAAVALGRAGIDCLVLEAAAALGRGGPGLTLRPRALRALERLGIGPAAVLRHAAPLESGEVVTRRGRRLTTIDLAEVARRVGRPLVCLKRADLCAELAARLGRAGLETGAPCHGYRLAEEGAVALLDDGGEVSGDLVVAADGVQSVMRAQLLGDHALRYGGWITWRGVARLPAGRFPRRHYRDHLGRGSRFALCAIRGDEVYWYGTRNAPLPDEAAEPPSAKQEALAFFGDWPDVVGLAIERTPDEEVVRTVVYDTDPLPCWTARRFALLGDAAHPLIPDLGRGGCETLQDALVLADSLAGCSTLDAGLVAYEGARQRQRAAHAGRARRISRVPQWSNPALVAARSAILWTVPPDLLVRVLETI